ncbi:MAG TPA: lysylphosphatidylglycerol synthase transmembrane domain-containing protein [Burkholderiaceae bacterium]|nr:lysylphosphatidylglycerol synthase transmembrane domain-containing protein [Burkholderiaceae bacterium]
MTARLGKLLLRVFGALALLALAVALVGPQRLLEQLRAVDLRWFGAALVCAAAANFVSAWRWAYIARAFGLVAPLAALVSAYAQGITVNVLLPGATVGGDALRSVRLARLGNPLAASALTVVLDRLSGLWMLCLISLFAALGFASWALASGRAAAQEAWQALLGAAGPQGLAFYVVALCAAVVLPFLPWRMPATATGQPANWRARLRARLSEVHALVLSRRVALVRSLWPSFVVQILSAGTLWLCARALGIEAGFLAIAAIAAPVFIAAALPFSLGGFGPREFAAGIAFALLGLPPPGGVASAVLFGLTAVAQGVLAAPLLALHGPQARTPPRPPQRERGRG